MLLSSQVVNAYAAPLGRAGGPCPLGLRGRGAAARRPRLGAQPRVRRPEPADRRAEDPGLANVILTNGARLYVDHAHPEYSSPEVTTPRDAVLWDKAGERVMLAAARRLAATPGAAAGEPVQEQHRQQGRLLRHPRELPDAPGDAVRRHRPVPDAVLRLAARWSPAPGGSGCGQDGTGVGFQVSQRADFFEVEVGLETTLKRPIINTRDEPHASADRFRRLHVIIGDANLCEVATYLKVGTTALVLELIEEKGFTADLWVDRPVAALHAVSHDPTLQTTLRLRDGRTADRRPAAVDVPRAGARVPRRTATAATSTR